MWFPPAMPEWTPPVSAVFERFCVACECSQTANGTKPCWNCGETTVARRPTWWPFSASATQVRNGNVWGPEEEHESC